jgi:hypothetical protein
MKPYLSIFLLLFIFSCKPISVSSTVNTKEPATDYHTFYWMPGIENQVEEMNGYVNNEIMATIETKLAKEMILKGYRIDKDSPEVLVNIEIVGAEKKSPELAEEAGNKYWSSYEERELPAGSMVIELIHSGKNKVFWQGIATDFLHEKPGKNLRRVEEAVHLVFENYQNKIFM